MSADPAGGFFRYVIAGCINRDYILPLSGEPQIDVLGGNLAYASIGLNLWGETAGLVARVDQDFPLNRMARFQNLGFDLSGIAISPESMDTRRFFAHTNGNTTHTKNPVQYFANRGVPFPPSLLGYQDKTPQYSSRTQPRGTSIKISDIPEDYLDANAVHICPIDYLSHLLLPSVFRQGQASTISLASDPGYMSPSFWDEMPGLLSEITAFITSETEIRSLFQGRQTDIWLMAENLGAWGPEYVLVKTTDWGYCLYDRMGAKRWIVPSYHSPQVVDPTGESDAFAGGFLAGYRQHYDPLEATMMGSVAASVVIEGSGVFYGLDAMPGLLDLRREALRDLVREI